MTDPQPPPPLQADTPIVRADGRIVPRYRPPEVGDGIFKVDLQQAPAAIRQLEEAAKELGDIRREAERLGRITPPTQDQVSRHAADCLQIAAVGGNGSFAQALDSGLLQINNMIAGLRSVLAQYGKTDEENEAA